MVRCLLCRRRLVSIGQSNTDMENPAKDIRRAMMVAKGLTRDQPMADGGYPVSTPSERALKQAIQRFSQQRAQHLQASQSTEPLQQPASSGRMSQQQLLANPPMPPPRPQTLGQNLGQASDLGNTLQTGYDMITGKPKQGVSDTGLKGNVPLYAPSWGSSPEGSPQRSKYAGSQPIANNAIPPQGRALLATLGGPGYESNGSYNQRFNQPDFDDYSWHPGTFGKIVSGPNAGRYSNAAGRYQFLSTTFDDEARRLGLKDFSPASQDAAAWDLAQRTYSAKYPGHDLGTDLQDPANLPKVTNALRSQWTSLPGGIEQGGKLPQFVRGYGANLQTEIARENSNTVPVQAAGPAAPTPSGEIGSSGANKPDAQGLYRVPNRDGSFTLTDEQGNQVGYDIGTAPLSAAPGPRPTVPSIPPTPAPAHSLPDTNHQASLGPPNNQGEAVPQSDQSSPSPDQSGASDPFANLYNKVALAPGVQSGYENFQQQYAPDDSVQAKRGGKIIDRALQIVRKHRASGGNSSTSNPGIIPQSPVDEEITPSALANDSSFPSGGGPISDNQLMELLSFSLDQNLPGQGAAPQSATPNVVNSPYTAPAPPQTYTPPNNSSVTNPAYGNTLDEVLGTNTPTMQQIFGFNYPQIPPPQPNIYAQPEASTLPSGGYSAPSTGSSGSATDTYNQGALFGSGITPTGAPPTLTNPPPLQTINGVPSIMPPLIANGQVGNYSNFNPNALSSNSVPMATPWSGNIGTPLAARGGSIGKALHLAHRASAKRG